VGVQFKVDGAEHRRGRHRGAVFGAMGHPSREQRIACADGGRAGYAGRPDLDPVAVTVFNDQTPPTVTLTAPALGAALRGTIAVSASASGQRRVGVQFRLDGNNLGAEDTAPAPMAVLTMTSASDGRIR
jgi:hypothetical protein